jgi:basic membrane protein A
MTDPPNQGAHVPRRARPLLALAAAITTAATLAACGSDTTASSSSGAKTTTVGFLYVGPKNDFGYNQAAGAGAAAVAKLPGVKILEAENVPETSEAARVMEKMIRDGATIIFPTSYGHLEPALTVARRHPEVTFEHQGGLKTAPNLGTYFGAIYEAQYLSGIAAGRVTKTGKLGYVVAFPIPQTLLNVNAFELGAKSVNPKATTTVVFTSSWCDPGKQAEATNSLVAQKVDVVSQHQDCTKTIVETTERKGAYSVGYHADASSLAPNGWLTGAIWNWGPMYSDIVKTIVAGTWKGSKYDGQYRVGFEDPTIQLAPFGKAVPAAVRKEIEAKEQAMRDGTFKPFTGPISDQSGKVRIAGASPDRTTLESTNYLVQGVVGKIPSS